METKNNLQPNEPENKNSLAAFGFFIWDLLKVFLIALAVIVPFRLLVAEPFMVSGSSMLPNYHNRDYLIIDRISYRFQEPQRGDVIVLKFPKDNTQYYIKRIIALPGETVTCNQGKVVISNFQGKEIVLDEVYLPSTIKTNSCKPKLTLGSGEYFVLGDNRTGSSDSRAWGILPKNDIVGRVWLRVFPFKDFGFFEAPVYAY